jgi:Domain of unknown function (DUF4386)
VSEPGPTGIPVLLGWSVPVALSPPFARISASSQLQFASRRLMSRGSTNRAVVACGNLLQRIADSLLSIRDHSTLAAVFAFTLGALMYHTLFYQSARSPMAVRLGAAAALLMLTACLLALFSNSTVTGYTFLILLIAVQELVMAVWLLVKGFSPVVQGRFHRPVEG